MRAEGEVTRGTTNPSRLRRVDRWITGPQRRVLLSAERPLVVDLGYGASPVTTVELYRAVRRIAPDAEVTGLEIDPDRVGSASRYLAARHAQGDELPGLSFARGGFELPVGRRPVLVRALNVLRQYPEERAWAAWHRLCDGLADGGALVEGTCDELGRRAVWVTLSHTSQTITFSARLASLERPSDLAERLPKVLIHRNVPGEPVHQFLRDLDHAWACAAPRSVFGPRQRWLAVVAAVAEDWPVIRQPPYGGQARWRLGELTLPWAALRPRQLSARSRHRAGDLRIHAEIVKRPGENRNHDRARLGAAGVRAVVVMALAAGDGANDQPHNKHQGSKPHRYLRVLRLGTDQPVPTPARCRARQASPASIRLVGEKTALVAVEVALIRNAIINKIAAT